VRPLFLSLLFSILPWEWQSCSFLIFGVCCLMTTSPLSRYLDHCHKESKPLDAGAVAYVANLTKVAEVYPEIASSIVKELSDQRSNLKLIASENFCSLSTQMTMSNLLTDKYAEGYSGHRFYAGCDNIDDIESIACKEACALFGAEHAYVQPHSGADANMIAFWAILHERVGVPALKNFGDKKINDLTEAEFQEFRKILGNHRLLGLDLYCGGHLTHGYRMNVSAQMFECHAYGVSKETGLLDYDAIEKQALEVKPLILLAGYSAYPRKVNFARMRAIADKVGAVFMVDMAHFAGLVAGKVFEGDYNPIPFAHIVTSTTHKTLRGPRGGLILCTSEFAEQVDKGCPLVIGGPLAHVMAAKAVAFKEARRPSFSEYAHTIVKNAVALGEAASSLGMKVLTGGTENHMILVDVRQFGINGRQAELAVRSCGITLNRNAVPYDPNGPWFTSGLRIGTPAVSSLGMGEAEMKEIASIIHLVLSNSKSAIIGSGANAGKPSKSLVDVEATVVEAARARVAAVLAKYPLYPEIDLGFLVKEFCS
jgi:glycine hydroxymethyltransferase